MNITSRREDWQRIDPTLEAEILAKDERIKELEAQLSLYKVVQAHADLTGADVKAIKRHSFLYDHAKLISEGWIEIPADAKFVIEMKLEVPAGEQK